MKALIPWVEEGDKSAIQKRVYGVKEAARVLNLSEKSVYRLIQRGKIKVKKALRCWLIPSEEIDRFINEEL